jgi:hypothetical protein
MHIDQVIVAIPLFVGLVGVGLAVFERGYKRFLDARKEDPTLKWDNSYMINILISAGGMSAIIAGVIPVLMEMIPDVVTAITVVSLVGNFFGGYLGTYRILDGLNNSTEQKTQLAKKNSIIAEQEKTIAKNP